MNFNNFSLAEVIILLIVGVATFLLGMHLMSSGLKKLGGRKVRNLFGRIKNNRFAGLGIGCAVTALIQSSDATSIMVIGFVNAGIVSIFQAVSVIMGAYIGTTATGLIVSLSSIGTKFSIDLIFMCFIFVGVVLTFLKSKVAKNLGELFCGLGILFLGLFILKGAFNYETINLAFQDLFKIISNPILLLVIGILITMLVQSSSVTTGLMIVMVSTGAVNIASAIYVALGATIGTVFTTVIATHGGSTNSKRIALIALLMRIIAALIAFVILWPLDSGFQIIGKMSTLFNGNVGLFLAVFMALFSLVSMFILLPFIKNFEKLSVHLVKDKKQESMKSYLKYINIKSLKNPYIALTLAKKEIDNMNHLAFNNFKNGFKSIIDLDFSKDKEIREIESAIDFLNVEITNFLIELSNNVDKDDSRIIGGYFHALNDIERIGDHALNFLESAISMKELNLKFSDAAKSNFGEIYELINKMFKETFYIFGQDRNEKVHIMELQTLENKVDVLKTQLASSHYQRIIKKECLPELSPFYTNLLSELERVADHLTNVGYVYLNPTGDVESEKNF